MEEKRAVWLQDVVLKISRVSSLQLNCILLFLQLDVIILDLAQEYSFVKKRKGKFFFNRNTCGQQEKKTNGRAGAGRCFYHEDKE